MSHKTEMIEEAIRNGQACLSDDGALVVETGKYTGRAAQERFIVKRPEIESKISWGKANQPMSPNLADRVFNYLEKRFSQERFHTFSGNISGHTLEVKSFSPWHIAFAENMFRKERPSFMKGLGEGEVIRIFHSPFEKANQLGLGFDREALIILDPLRKQIAIIGTAYAGEIKKSAFSMANYILPEVEVLSMHASANCLKDGSETCILFGLSGTGKTTLSASGDRYLIGDDEIVWTRSGISNLEAGCYAKLIDLTEEREGEIFRATNRFGSIAENVQFFPGTRKICFTDRCKAENTRGSYPLTSYEKVFHQDREAFQAKTMVFLVADAFGAMPAVAKLNSLQAQYHFISGYTAKVAGTELGVKEPQATFSACFGEPFMPRDPSVYARMLEQFAAKNGTSIWLLNTGWCKGGYGKGERFPLSVTRQILSSIQNGKLDHASFVEHPIFGFQVPRECPGVDSIWLENPTGEAVTAVAMKFVTNIDRFSQRLDRKIVERGGPRF